MGDFVRLRENALSNGQGTYYCITYNDYLSYVYVFISFLLLNANVC